MDYTTIKFILAIVGFIAGMQVGSCAQHELIVDKINLACEVSEE